MFIAMTALIVIQRGDNFWTECYPVKCSDIDPVDLVMLKVLVRDTAICAGRCDKEDLAKVCVYLNTHEQEMLEQFPYLKESECKWAERYLCEHEICNMEFSGVYIIKTRRMDM